MVDKLGDLLAGKFQAPDEIGIIKDFVHKKFNSAVSVEVHPNSLVIGVDNAALASELRFVLPKLQEKLKTNKKLIIRIQ